MKALQFFRSKGVIAAYHHPDSLTWRWSLTWQWRFFPQWLNPLKFIMFARMAWSTGGQATVCLGPIALNYHWQEPMWKETSA